MAETLESRGIRQAGDVAAAVASAMDPLDQQQHVAQQQQQQQHSPHQHDDMTVHTLAEETVERPFLFILFNDIMIQCNPITPVGKASTIAATDLSSSIGAASTVSSMAAAGPGGSAGGESQSRNLELCRVLQLESRLHPAELIGQDVLRVVDDAMILYLTGDRESLQAWKDDINSR
ncbi:hypothetical protein BGZ73_001553, partial [Actinomortierella ambigua]